jgi:hypothetical protein
LENVQNPFFENGAREAIVVVITVVSFGGGTFQVPKQKL